MGLQTEVSEDSPLLLLLLLLVRTASYLHALLLNIMHALGFHSISQQHLHQYPIPITSGMAALVLLCDQLNLNTSCSSSASQRSDHDCVVCLNPMREGDQLRTLPCRHAFHKDCFQAWLHQLNFTCPLCRAPLVSHDRRLALACLPFR